MASSTATAAADVVVVGLGAMGAATALQARRLGRSVIGIDRHHPPHRLGSTHAETRITRLAVGEGPQYLPLVRRSHELWRSLETESGRRLLWETGGLILTEQTPTPGDRWDDFAVRTHAIGADAGIPVSLLDPADASRRCPPLQVPDDVSVAYEPTAGLVACEAAVTAQLDLARAAGAALAFGETVMAVEPDDDGVDVFTDRGRYRADQVVLAAGPWLASGTGPDPTPGGPGPSGGQHGFGLAAPVDAEALTVTRQVVYWFEADDPAAFTVEAMPFVMWVGETIDDYLAVFPTPPGMTAAVKVLGEQFDTTTDPDRVDRVVSAEEIARFHARNVAPRVRGLSERCVRAEVCLYTNTADDDFLIDTHPETDRVTLISACSGHGFKHSAALGEAVAQRLVLGASTIDLSPFARRQYARPA